MDVNLELIKRIISSDELCDKVNSGDNKDVYIEQIKDYVLHLVNESINVNSIMDYVNRYLNKFVLSKNKEDIFFDEVLLKCFSLNIKDSLFLDFLNKISFLDVKENLNKKYKDYIVNKVIVSKDSIEKMLLFYYYIFPDYVFSSLEVNYFTYHLYKFNISLNKNIMIFYYKQLALCFSRSKGINTYFVVLDEVVVNDPYYDNVRNKIAIYKKNISNSIDLSILSDVFFQITYLYILNGINNNGPYTYDQLELVKEICLISILGDNYYDINYSHISYSSKLKRQSIGIVKSYFKSLGIDVIMDDDINGLISFDNKIDDKADKPISVDVLFDLVLKNENPNLISSLVKRYPILGNEYRNGKKKSLLDLIMDICSNRKLLINLNKDLEWQKKKEYDSVESVIEKLNKKIIVCKSCIDIMNFIVMKGDMTSYDLFRSISDLITYSHSNKLVKNDICMVLKDVIPKKISRLCDGRSSEYKNYLKKKFIKCYLDSLGLVKNQLDVDYFMKLYSTLELCIAAFDS